MGIIAWLILGAFSGWIASIIMGKNASMGAIANISNRNYWCIYWRSCF